MKKIWKRKGTWIAIFICIFAISALYLFNKEAARDMEETNQNLIQNRIDQFHQWAAEADATAVKAKQEGDAATADEQAFMADRFAKSIKKYEELKIAYDSGDWDYIYSADLEGMQLVVENPQEAQVSIEEQRVDHFTLRASYEEKQQLLERGLIPLAQEVFFNSLMPTLYNEFTGYSAAQWEQMTERYGTVGWNILYQFTQYFLIPITILLGAFLFGNSVSSESMRKKRGLHFFQVLPVSKGRVFIAKYLVSLIHTILFTGMILMIPLGLSLMDRGIGSLAYPVLVYDGPDPSAFGNRTPVPNGDYDTFHFISLSDYFIQALWMTLLMVFFIYTVYFFLSLWIRHAGATLLVTGSVLFIGTMVGTSPWNPFQYLDVHRILTQENRVLLVDNRYTLQNGLLALGLTGLVLWLLSFGKYHQLKVK
ncbi:hypothetical protein [Paenisporosarcina sp. OV554]|uniref:hypothetical protein n=1 Tax=Paenisporosarcina sp. OV554 TaxID=2135694 RepID=UPI001E45752C|nr:hypothetical protein [Paenisporosarcina sp. OV554]